LLYDTPLSPLFLIIFYNSSVEVEQFLRKWEAYE
jgi:hypothetical protein